ncbi:MAG TPA: hypothetical protein DCY13_02840 [Verrucomicrobiales bacterium]|nr:hypothetical protein [Verrucomicrobiales bacterium]
MRSITRLLSLATCLAVIGLSSAHAQLAPGTSDIPGLDQAMRKLFEGVEGFTTEAVMDIKGGGQNVKLTVAMAMLKGDSWTEVDMGRMEGAAVPPQMLEAFRKVGMDKMQILTFAGTGREVMIYPGLKAYAESKPARAKADKEGACKTERTVTGTEEVAGRMCEKSTMKIKCDEQAEITLTVWSDKKNRNLPVKLATAAEGVELTIQFGELKLKAPEKKLFDVPADYKKHASVEELMMANMQKMMQAMQGQQ